MKPQQHALLRILNQPANRAGMAIPRGAKRIAHQLIGRGWARPIDGRACELVLITASGRNAFKKELAK